MEKQYKLKNKNDLIKIYEKGEFEQFKSAYEIYSKESKEFLKLLQYFEHTYYPEFYYPGVDFSKTTFDKMQAIQNDNPALVLKHLDWDNIIFTPKDIIQDDPNYERFIELAKTRMGAKNPRREKMFLREDFKDEFGREFAFKYLIRDLKFCTYITLKEDARKAEIPEVYDFILKNPTYRYNRVKIQVNRFINKVKRIRSDAGLTVEQVASLATVEPYIIERIEKQGFPIDNTIIDVYAKLGDMSVNELLEFDDYKEIYRSGLQNYDRVMSFISFNIRSKIKHYKKDETMIFA